jgi:hypothetical protein
MIRLLSVLLLLSATASADEAIMLHHARIISVDALTPEADAMVFEPGGKILAVGREAALRRRYPDIHGLDAGGHTVVPGLIDAHGHVLGLGTSLLQADLVGTRSVAEVIARVQAFERELPADAWLIGRGWDQNDWPTNEFPTAADLDAAFPERPVWLERVDGHAGWANRAALRRVTRDLDGAWQPEGGRIMRDGTKATGVFVDGAMALVEQAMPAPSAAFVERALKRAFAEMVKFGLTGVHDAGVSLGTLKAMRALADADALPLRLYTMADGDGAALDWLCEHGVYTHERGRLRMRAVKLYADGALGSRGAQLLVDYSDDAGNRGLAVTAPDDLRAAVRKAHGCGVQVAVHAIGDGGNRHVLDAFAAVLPAKGAPELRWRIEHAQIVALGDIPRFAQLGIIASMQPTHATSDMPWAEQRVGAARIVGGYAWRRFRDAGVRLALGSDFPVERVDPLLGLYAAMTRQDAQGQPQGGWYASERLTGYEALRGFTLDAAYAGFMEDEVGSLTPGKRADFVILSRDPVGAAPREILDTHVLATYVDGRAVYQAEDRM